jgi:hypothetical protein
MHLALLTICTVLCLLATDVQSPPIIIEDVDIVVGINYLTLLVDSRCVTYPRFTAISMIEYADTVFRLVKAMAGTDRRNQSLIDVGSITELNQALSTFFSAIPVSQQREHMIRITIVMHIDGQITIFGMTGYNTRCRH